MTKYRRPVDSLFRRFRRKLIPSLACSGAFDETALRLIPSFPLGNGSVRTGHRVHAAEHVGLSRPAYGYAWGYPGYAFAASGPNYTCPGYGYAAARPVGFGIGFGFRPSW